MLSEAFPPGAWLPSIHSVRPAADAPLCETYFQAISATTNTTGLRGGTPG